MEFKLNLSLKELRKRTSKRYFSEIKFLSETSREIKNLSVNDLLVLLHLTRASFKFESINLKLENHQNLNFLKYLNKEIENENEKARLTKLLFEAQKSIFSPDSLGNRIVLAKNVSQALGRGFYPEDLMVQEFHSILNKMLDEGKIDEVKQILSQRTVVVRDGKSLKAIDYVEYFPEFREVAEELEKAQKYCDDKEFSNYLELQSKALKTADPMLDAEADKAWAKLVKSKFEFTITRESYEEQMTNSISENKELSERLEKLNIPVLTKDSLGARVGVVNRAGTKFLSKLKNLTEIEAKLMPFCEKYSSNTHDISTLQTAVDVDLISLTGEEGAYRGGIVVAQNLPNDDKPSLSIGGGRRNVYHRQIRKKINKKLFKNLITESQFEYIDVNAEHWATICHENTHTVGPNPENSLGKYTAILEEYKADMGMYAFLKEFKEAGVFTERQTKQIIVTSLANSFAKAKPALTQPHRVRSCMIVNRMITDKAITFDETGKLVFDFDKVIITAKEMMSEVVNIQLNKDFSLAEAYIEKWFCWTQEMEVVAEIIKKYSKKLNGYLTMPLARLMLSEEFENTLKSKL